MSAAKVSAVILRGVFKFTLLVDMVLFSTKNAELSEMEIKDSFRLCNFRKCLLLIFRIMPLFGYIYSYVNYILARENLVFMLLHSGYLVTSLPCYLWVIGLQLFHGKAVNKLVKKILRLLSRVRTLPLQRNIGFGGERELVLIIVTLLSEIMELVLIFINDFSWNFIIGWSSLTHVIMIRHSIMRIHIIWYLQVGVLYSEVNDYVRVKMQLLNPQEYHKLKPQLEEFLSLYREIYNMDSSFQPIFNMCIFFVLLHNLFYIVVFSYTMIIDIHWGDLLMWFLFVKVIFDFLLITLAVEGAGNQYKGIRQIQFEMCCLGENKDLHRLMEVFATQSNLYPFRVSLLGLCDVSMKLFLEVLSGVVAYLIFVIQCMLQIKKS